MVRKKRPSQAPGTAPSSSSGAPIVPKVPNGLPHGQRQVLEAQASAGASAGGSAPASSPPGGGPPFRVPSGGIMGPTTRPGEPITAGAPVGAGPGPEQPMLPDDPDLWLKTLAQKFPHPDIIALLERPTFRSR